MRIAGTGAAIPQTVVSNDAVEGRLGLEHGWIERRTGIRQRPVALPEEATSDLATRAAAQALEASGIDPKTIGLVLLATSTPDHLLPPTAPLVAHRLGCRGAGAIDLAGACSGFLYALTLANAHGQNTKTNTLVIGANILTRRVNERDPATAALFSDGAGAVVLAPCEPSSFLGTYLSSDGSLYDVIGIQAGGSREPVTAEALAEGRQLMTIRNGSALFKHGVHAMVNAGRAAIENAGLTMDAVDWWIPHQANARMIRETGSLLGISAERAISVVETAGNSSAATIPIALAHAAQSGQLRQGQIVLLTAAGAGIIYAGVVLRW
jgi:3-oxoacyl-[acyl-carrier-protein] synthase-3